MTRHKKGEEIINGMRTGKYKLSEERNAPYVILKLENVSLNQGGILFYLQFLITLKKDVTTYSDFNATHIYAYDRLFGDILIKSIIRILKYSDFKIFASTKSLDEIQAAIKREWNARVTRTERKEKMDNVSEWLMLLGTKKLSTTGNQHFTFYFYTKIKKDTNPLKLTSIRNPNANTPPESEEESATPINSENEDEDDSKAEESIKEMKNRVKNIKNEIRAKSARVVGNGVSIRKSSIDGAGNGLFADVNFNTKDIITEYTGEYIDRAKADELRRLRKHTHVRAVEMGRSYIDGYKDPSLAIGKGGASFTNHKPGKEANAKFVTIYDSNTAQYRVYIKAKRPILKGEEIFVDYGKNYWTSFE